MHFQEDMMPEFLERYTGIYIHRKTVNINMQFYLCLTACLFYLFILFFSCALFGMQDLQNYDNSLLCDAISKGDTATVSIYLQQKIFSVNDLIKYGEAPLHIASSIKDSKKRYNMVKILLEGNADPNTLDGPNKRSSLYNFVSNDQVSEVNLLLQHKADIGLQDYRGNTIFHGLASFCSNIVSYIYRGAVGERCFALPMLRLKTLLLCKKRIDSTLKAPFPKPLIHIIACLADPICKTFLNHEFNNTLLKKNHDGEMAYDIVCKKHNLAVERQWLINFLKPHNEDAC